MRLMTASLVTALALAPLAARAEGDAAAGQRVFNQCRACHVIADNHRNGVGPNLHGVIGRRAASVDNYSYSSAMKAYGEAGHVWTEEALHPYLANPRQVVPGTKMTFQGLRNPQQIEDVIAYLKSQSS